MENPKSYTFGKFMIPEPCGVPWEDMERQAQRSRHCLQCKKSVFDISGMSPSQIEALEAKNGGRICGTFFLNNPPLDKDPEPLVRYRLVPSWLKGAAAAAALTMFLLQPPKTFASSKGTGVHYGLTLPGNAPEIACEGDPFLLSTVILNEFEENIEDDLIVTVRLPNGEKREITTKAGFFSLPLEGIAEADQWLEISIAPQVFESYQSTRTYPASKTRVSTNDAQNFKFVVQVAYKYNHMLRGDIQRR